MKKTVAMAGLLALSMVFAACSNTDSSNTDKDGNAQNTSQAGFEQGDKVVAAFENAGYTISDISTESQKCSFKAVSTNGGSNVTVSAYDGDQAAQEAFSSEQATLSQSDYYITAEENTETSWLTTFSNSINYNDAVLALNMGDKTLVDIREINQESLDEILALVQTLGIDTAAIASNQ